MKQESDSDNSIAHEWGLILESDKELRKMLGKRVANISRIVETSMGSTEIFFRSFRRTFKELPQENTLARIAQSLNIIAIQVESGETLCMFFDRPSRNLIVRTLPKSTTKQQLTKLFEIEGNWINLSITEYPDYADEFLKESIGKTIAGFEIYYNDPHEFGNEASGVRIHFNDQSSILAGHSLELEPNPFIGHAFFLLPQDTKLDPKKIESTLIIN
ncbi:MAG: hypothetical protein NXI24_16935 [bacterium]|nr:hypothetical protein [bacterium]